MTTPLTTFFEPLSKMCPGLHETWQTLPTQLVKVETGSILILLFFTALFFLSSTLPQPGVTKLPLAVKLGDEPPATVLSASGASGTAVSSF